MLVSHVAPGTCQCRPCGVSLVPYRGPERWIHHQLREGPPTQLPGRQVDAICRLGTPARIFSAQCPEVRTAFLAPPIEPRPTSASSAKSTVAAGFDVSVIALWLGHESLESTNAYLHADMTLKKRTLARTTPPDASPWTLPAARPLGRPRPAGTYSAAGRPQQAAATYSCASLAQLKPAHADTRPAETSTMILKLGIMGRQAAPTPRRARRPRGLVLAAAILSACTLAPISASAAQDGRRLLPACA